MSGVKRKRGVCGLMNDGSKRARMCGTRQGVSRKERVPELCGKADPGLVLKPVAPFHFPHPFREGSLINVKRILTAHHRFQFDGPAEAARESRLREIAWNRRSHRLGDLTPAMASH